MANKKNKLRHWLAKIYYDCLSIYISFKGRIYGTKFNPSNVNDIPIIINNRNRLTYLIKLLEFLKKCNCSNIIIIDNDSTFPPLLKYYKNCPYQIVFLKKNLGYLALEKSDLWPRIKKDYFVYTDPDVVPVDQCPLDFMKYFFECLQKNSKYMKVGFSLKIDDLPDHYDQKHKVIEWESQFYKEKHGSDFFKAKIDTTFALHRPWSKIGHKGLYKHLRSAFPYEARHLPWYENSLIPTKEDIYYKNHAEIGGFWTNGWKNKLFGLSKK